MTKCHEAGYRLVSPQRVHEYAIKAVALLRVRTNQFGQRKANSDEVVYLSNAS